MAPILRKFRIPSERLNLVERNARNWPELMERQIVYSRTISGTGVLWAPVS